MIDEYEYQRFIGQIASTRYMLVESGQPKRGLDRHRRCRQWLLTEVAVRLMGDGGLRVGEVCGLMWGDVWLVDRVVEVVPLPPEICKGRRGREIPLTRQVRAVLGMLRDFEADRWAVTPNRYVMHSSSTGKALDQRQIRRWCERAGTMFIGQAVRPHDLRRLFGRRIRRIADVAVAQRLLGHRTLAHTDRYTAATEDECLQAVRQLNGGQHPTGTKSRPGASGRG